MDENNVLFLRLEGHIVIILSTFRKILYVARCMTTFNILFQTAWCITYDISSVDLASCTVHG